MAINDEIREQKKKLKGKGIRAHLQWFWDYEKIPTVIVIIAAVVAITVIWQRVHYKPYAFGVLFLNADITDFSEEETISAKFMEYAGIDDSAYQLFTDLSSERPVGETSATIADTAEQEKLFAELSTNEVDVAVMDLVNFNFFMPNELFSDLRETLDEETLKKYEGQIYYVDRTELESEESEEDENDADSSDTASYEEWQARREQEAQEEKNAEMLSGFVLPDPSLMDDPVPVGIVVNDAPLLQKYHNYDEVVAVFGIVSGGQHPELCQSFLEYLYEK